MLAVIKKQNFNARAKEKQQCVNDIGVSVPKKKQRVQIEGKKPKVQIEGGREGNTSGQERMRRRGHMMLVPDGTNTIQIQ